MDMDYVNTFNSELSSLYDVKPPISKGKMTAITRAALKAVKLYKHVVQSVEKFIQKCKPEYKVPGLYVIDSIIRQSRHQFGLDKDVFANRFARNITSTFVHLYKCPDEDKAKVIRVLNLWQKNKIFMPDVIQPLFDLADPNNPIWESIQQSSLINEGTSNNNSHQMNQSGTKIPTTPTDSSVFPPQVQFKKELLAYDYGEDEDNNNEENNSSGMRNNNNIGSGGSGTHHSNFNQNQTDHQSGIAGLDALGSILANPEVLKHLQTFQEQLAAVAQQQQQQQQQHQQQQHQQQIYLTPEQERQRKLAELNKQEAAFDQRLAQTVARLPFAVDCDLQFSESNKSPSNARDRDTNKQVGYQQQQQQHENIRSDIDQMSSSNQQNPSGLLLPPPFFQQMSSHDHSGQQMDNSSQQQSNPFGYQMPPFSQPPPSFPPPNNQNQNMHQNMFSQQMMENTNSGFGMFNQNQSNPFDQLDLSEEANKDRSDRKNERRRRRSRSKSRENSKSRRRSRSTSRGRTSRKRFNKSRSKSRDKKEDKEREKERLRKGFPSPRREYVSVCSTTLWVGHLSKLVSQEELSDTFGAYGDIISIEVIAPRGCAFIVMNRRQDACRALDRLKNAKMQGKQITLAWAPGKGVKGRDWKDYWEVGSGVSFIPWSKLQLDSNVNEFEDGGCVDEDTLPEALRENFKLSKPSDMKDSQTTASSNENSINPEDGPIPLPPPSIIPNMSNLIVKTGDIDNRQLPLAPPPQGFGIPPGMLGMGMNIMGVPPPNMMPPMQFPPMGLPPMPMMPPQFPPHPQQNIPGPGLLGEMPPTQPPQLGIGAIMQNHNNQLMANQMNEVVGGMDHPNVPISSSSNMPIINDDERKRRSERRDQREKKRSRFEDIDEMKNRTEEPNASPDNENKNEDFPLHERLKSMSDGYPFGAPNNREEIGGGMVPPPGSQMPPNPYPPPLLPMRGGGNQFGGGRNSFMGGEGQGPWFEGPPGNMHNPFINPNPNPFAGNPFMQNNMNENPFDIGGPPPSNIGGPPPDGPYFGNNEGRGGGGNNFGGRGNWGGGGGRDGPNNWRGGRGGPRGRGNRRGRGGGWDNNNDNNNEWRGEDEGSRFGGRGGGGRRGGRDWDRDDKQDNRGKRERSRDRGSRRDRDRDRGGDRDNFGGDRDSFGGDRDSFGRDRRRRSFEEDKDDPWAWKPKPLMSEDGPSPYEKSTKEYIEENWDEPNEEGQEREGENENINKRPINTEEESWDDPQPPIEHPQYNSIHNADENVYDDNDNNNENRFNYDNNDNENNRNENEKNWDESENNNEDNSEYVNTNTRDDDDFQHQREENLDHHQQQKDSFYHQREEEQEEVFEDSVTNQREDEHSNNQTQESYVEESEQNYEEEEEEISHPPPSPPNNNNINIKNIPFVQEEDERCIEDEEAHDQFVSEKNIEEQENKWNKDEHNETNNLKTNIIENENEVE